MENSNNEDLACLLDTAASEVLAPHILWQHEFSTDSIANIIEHLRTPCVRTFPLKRTLLILQATPTQWEAARLHLIEHGFEVPVTVKEGVAQMQLQQGP